MMNLKKRAETDLAKTLENENDFGMPITVTNPGGRSEIFFGQTGNVHLLYDPDTGAEINNQIAHISLRINSLYDAGFELPRAVPAENENPWIFEFAGTDDILRKYTVSYTRPDWTLGIMTILLTAIKEEG